MPSKWLVLTDEEAVRGLRLEAVKTAIREGFVLAGMRGAYQGSRVHIPVEGGAFHVVTGGLPFPDHPIVVTKVNGRFEPSSTIGTSPTVRGAMLVSSALDGRPIALLGSGQLTVLRTAGVAAVAVSELARAGSSTLLVVGAGRVAVAGALAIAASFPISRVLVAARNQERQDELVRSLSEAGGQVAAIRDIDVGLAQADIVLTATSSRAPLFDAERARPGMTFIAMGADAPGKQELPSRLVAEGVLVTDSTPQCAEFGELGHALRAGLMAIGDVRAELSEVVSGSATGRSSPDEIVVFDSTGTAIADAAIARAVLDNNDARRGRIATE